MEGGRVCAVVVNWNRKDDTLSCLSSLGMASGIGRTVIVDNGSIDGSVGAVRQQFPDATVIEVGQNLGFAAASNLGATYFLERTSCRYLLLLNNDVIIASNMVEQLTKAAEVSEVIGVTVPKIYYASPPDRLWYAGGYIDWKQGSCEHYGFGEQDKGQFDHQRDVSFACGAAMLIKRGVVERLGLFDERYYMFEEDVEFSIRVARAGYVICYTPKAQAWHRVGASATTRGDSFVWYYLIRNRLYTMRAYAHLHQWLLFLSYFPFLCVWKGVLYALRGDPMVATAIARGIIDHLRGRTGETFEG
jgi:hypothetical protein